MRSACPRKEVCGSCPWSHIPYARQLRQKLADVNAAFARQGLRLRCEEILPSPRLGHYRNRMDFAIDFQGRVGLRQRGKWWRVIDGHACFLAEEQIEGLFGRVREWVRQAGLAGYDRKTQRGLLRHAIVRATRCQQAMVVLVTSDPHQAGGGEAAVLPALEELGRLIEPASLVWAISRSLDDVSRGEEVRVIAGADAISEEIAGALFRIGPLAFFQTNSYAAPLLLETAGALAGDLSGRSLLDLYCGVGFFGVGLGRSAKRVLAVEHEAAAAADARLNAEQNRVALEVLAAPAEELDLAAAGAEVLIVDPPRAGVGERVIAKMLEDGPPTAVYVSCNPHSLAREIAQLSHVYQVEALRAVDMFPQTPHVELVVRLARRTRPSGPRGIGP